MKNRATKKMKENYKQMIRKKLNKIELTKNQKNLRKIL